MPPVLEREDSHEVESVGSRSPVSFTSILSLFFFLYNELYSSQSPASKRRRRSTSVCVPPVERCKKRDTAALTAIVSILNSFSESSPDVSENIRDSRSQQEG